MEGAGRVRGLILFDIDGTLLRVGDPEHHLAFVHAMERVYGLPATLEGVPLAGMLDSQIARLALSRHGLSDDEIDAQLAEMIAIMGEHYTAAVAKQSRIERVLPGVLPLAERLQAEAFALGVLTGNARAVAHAKLAAADILRFFPVGAFGDAARERGHLVEEAWHHAEQHYGVRFAGSQTVLLGDTPRDIDAARAAGTRVVAVATGRYSIDDLTAHEPDAVFPDLSRTETVLAAIHDIVDEERPGSQEITGDHA
jgi:phosphoglycolate phosphatase-like HAD superfamily hydrolase